MEDTIPVDIPTTLLQKAKTLNKDTIGRKYDFLTTKGNEFIQVDPPSAKFAGYEINKLNTIKIKVLNKATIPQRIHVLPLESNTFTVKMNKKGLLPTGMAEELLISFKPTEYKYFFDTLRINTETENILVPIHAYPVLDRDNLRNIFPRLIDFGTIIIGETSTITSFLTCKIPINFEFEFVFTNHHPDMVISPIKGIIPGSGNVEISIQYTASTNTTIVCEAELRISQFDFEPLKIRLMGSGRYEDPAQNKKKLALTSTQGGILQRPHSNPRLQRLDRSGLQGSIVNNDQEKASQLVNSQNIIKEEDNKKNEEISSKTQQQLKGNGTVEDEKLSLSMRASKDKNFKVRSLAQPGSSASALMKNSSKVTYKLTKEDIEEQQDNEEEDNSRQRNSEEREFIEKCNAVQLMDKNKDVKFFQCVGDEELTEQEINSINQERTDFNQGVLDDIHEEGIHRYTKKVNADHVLLGQRNLELQTECTWDEDKNDSLKLRKHILSKFMNAGTRIILKMRMENRLMKLKNLLCDCKNKADVKQLVINDWLKAEYAGVGQKEFIAFEFDYSENDVEENLLPVQYEASNTINEFKFEVTPRKDFIDLDLHDYTLFGRNEVEVMKYSNYDRPLCPNYAPIEESRQNRTGAEWEYSSNGRIGQTKQFSESEGLLDPMAKTYLKPIEMPSHHFITQHNTLRPYIPSQLFTEVDVEYYLQPETMQLQDSLDPNIQGEFFSLKNEFLGKTPGLSSRFALYSVYSEPLRYLPPLLKLPRDCGYIDKSEMHCPHALKECDYDDHLTDDDSDGEEPPVVEALNADDLLKQLEDKDEVMKKLREINSERLPFDELENTVNIINSNFHDKNDEDDNTDDTKSSKQNQLKRHEIKKTILKLKKSKSKKFISKQLCVQPIDLLKIVQHNRFLLYLFLEVEGLYHDLSYQDDFPPSEFPRSCCTVEKVERNINGKLMMFTNTIVKSGIQEFSFLIEHFEDLGSPIYKQLANTLKIYQTYCLDQAKHLKEMKEKYQGRIIDEKDVQNSRKEFEDYANSTMASMFKETDYYLYLMIVANPEEGDFNIFSVTMSKAFQELMGLDVSSSINTIPNIINLSDLLGLNRIQNIEEQVLLLTGGIETVTIEQEILTIDEITLTVKVKSGYLDWPECPSWMRAKDNLIFFGEMFVGQNQLQAIEKIRQDRRGKFQKTTQVGFEEEVLKEMFIEKYYPHEFEERFQKKQVEESEATCFNQTKEDLIFKNNRQN